MQIIESFVQGKRKDQSLCEDGFVVTPHFAAVIDGSTSKIEGRHGGREAMTLIKEALHDLPADACKSEMLSAFTKILAKHNLHEAKANAAYRLTCSAVIYSAAHRVVWMVGDCQCRWNGQTHTNPKLVDKVLTEARCDALNYLLNHGHTAQELRQHDLGRAFILNELRMQTNFQNSPEEFNPFSYTVFDGMPINNDKVKEWHITPHTTVLILASDGYPILCDTLSESETELQRLLQKDPLCMNENAGTKCWIAGNNSFDDRCYLKILL